jgi:hypothetical protein
MPEWPLTHCEPYDDCMATGQMVNAADLTQSRPGRKPDGMRGLPVRICVARRDGTECLATQLLATIEQLPIGGPDLEKISAVKVVFVRLAFS